MIIGRYRYGFLKVFSRYSSKITTISNLPVKSSIFPVEDKINLQFSTQSNFFMSSMAKFQVPTACKLDPTEIPLVELTSVVKVKVNTRQYSEYQSFEGDSVVFCFASADGANKFALPKDVSSFDDAKCNSILNAVLENGDFKSEAGQSASGVLPASSCYKVVGALGLGLKNTASASKAGVALANIFKDNAKLKHAAIVLPEAYEGVDADESRLLQCMLENFLVTLHPDLRFKGEASRQQAKLSQLESVTLYAHNPSVSSNAVEAAKKVALGVHFARQLVDAPANYCNTVSLAKAACEMATKVGLTCEVLDEEKCVQLGMGCYLAVCKGSMYPPQFIHLTYKSTEGGNLKKICFIGKGLCFDAGGYNIKNAACQIELMKYDMGGAAAVLGAALAIGQLKPPGVEVHFIVAAAENMVSSRAYRPGDVLVASNGKTVEIGNTDAEGRLTLADALIYAENLKPDYIIDMATLTGACRIALGLEYAGFFTPQDELATLVEKCGRISGEKLWRLPLVQEYKECLDSKCADMNNVGGKGLGGAITAAVFLNEFVQNTPWSHIDIAGPAFDGKTNTATGYGVRILTTFTQSITN